MSYPASEEENQAASFLRKRGWRVIAPVESEPIKETGAYQIVTEKGIHYVEGFEGDEPLIRKQFKDLGFNVDSITFRKDGFFDF